MSTILNRYSMGDMQCIYFVEEENRNVELLLLPQGMEYREEVKEKPYRDSLVQIKIAGDTYLGGYAGGNTMRQGASVTGFALEGQTAEEKRDVLDICTVLRDQRNYRIEHHLVWKRGRKNVTSYSVFQNQGGEAAVLEMFSSYSLGRISPFLKGDGKGKMMVHRLRSVWSMEGRLESKSLEELQLEPSWAGHAVRVERFGQVGSMPVNRYFPYLVLEDTQNHVFWGAQLAHNASWQMEVYRRGDDVAMSGGLADREFGHWMKTVRPGEQFVTPAAILSVCRDGGIDCISQRMTQALEEYADAGPASEQELPVIFNEYCTTWGCPSHKNISEILNAIRGKGFSYFVIDCGWYKQEGIPWDIAMGDYEVSKELFPEGLGKTVELIRENGLKPGIWFEIENVGSASKAYHMEEHLLKRDGRVLTTTMRRFWDMRDGWVQDYLSEKVIGMLKKYGFSYMKIDYNDTIGLGCDGDESLGEGLRRNMEESFAFVQKVKEEVPDIILENCASGGHRLEPLMMGACSMASFSDAHECEEIPIIAANLHRAILPRQSQIWAVIRKEDSLKRIAYSMASTFLGRMCISGDVLGLTQEQWQVIDSGIAFYKRIAPVIKKGYMFRFGPEIGGYRHPEGWQGILRTGETGDAYVVFHSFYGEKEGVLEIPLPEGEYRVEEVYSYETEHVWIEEGMLRYQNTEEMKAAAIYLTRVDI